MDIPWMVMYKNIHNFYFILLNFLVNPAKSHRNTEKRISCISITHMRSCLLSSRRAAGYFTHLVSIHKFTDDINSQLLPWQPPPSKRQLVCVMWQEDDVSWKKACKCSCFWNLCNLPFTVQTGFNLCHILFIFFNKKH